MKTILLILSIIIISACSEIEPKQIIEKGTLDNQIQLELLFEHDSCKIYRFNDATREIYYTDCRGQIGYQYTTRTSKTSTSTHYVDNNTIK